MADNSNFRKLVMSLDISEEERTYFIQVCSNWSLYCKTLTGFGKLETMKMIKYLITERSKSKRLLMRCIGRFNRLNTLTKEEL